MPEFDVQQLPTDFDGLIVLSTDQKLGRFEIERIAQQWQEVCAEDHRVAILDNGMRIEALGDDDLRRIGLQRIPA